MLHHTPCERDQPRPILESNARQEQLVVRFVRTCEACLWNVLFLFSSFLVHWTSGVPIPTLYRHFHCLGDLPDAPRASFWMIASTCSSIIRMDDYHEFVQQLAVFSTSLGMIQSLHQHNHPHLSAAVAAAAAVNYMTGRAVPHWACVVVQAVL